MMLAACRSVPIIKQVFLSLFSTRLRLSEFDNNTPRESVSSLKRKRNREGQAREVGSCTVYISSVQKCCGKKILRGKPMF